VSAPTRSLMGDSNAVRPAGRLRRRVVSGALKLEPKRSFG
jgi:hypothetical protein